MAPEIKHELCVIDSILCRGLLEVVPLALQEQIIELSHRGHQRMSKAELLLISAPPMWILPSFCNTRVAQGKWNCGEI